jgi:hypothetical protein
MSFLSEAELRCGGILPEVRKGGNSNCAKAKSTRFSSDGMIHKFGLSFARAEQSISRIEKFCFVAALRLNLARSFKAGIGEKPSHVASATIE